VDREEIPMTDVAMVKGLYEAAGRGEPGVLMAALDPAIEWHEAEGSPYAAKNPYVGPGGVGALLGQIAADIGDFRLAPRTFTGGDGIVLVEGRYTGTGAKTGKALDAQFAHVWHLRDGKVVRFQQYTDTRQWSSVLGDPQYVA
jgi:ketosteroid isomerase-like protein